LAVNPEHVAKLGLLEPEVEKLLKARTITTTEAFGLSIASSLKRAIDLMERHEPKPYEPDGKKD
jgi:hypothetical protein